jgi:AcrR family transcriptional regulator
MRKRDEHKKEAIIKAAIGLINKIGFAETSISKIAKQAGVSPATIYIYFKNKEDLLNKLYLHVKSKMAENFQFKRDSKISWEENFKKSYLNIANYLLKNSDSLLFMEQCSTNPNLTQATREEGMQMFFESFTFINDGITEKAIKPLELPVIVSAVSGPLFMAINESAKTGNQLDRKFIDQLSWCAWDSIKS